METEATTPRYYCPDCPTPAGDCQCNWSERVIVAHEASLEALAKKHPIEPSRFADWIDVVLGQSYAHLKALRSEGDEKCITHLSDVIHHLGELKEQYWNQFIPF
jgi:hypothetical protein